MDNAQEELYRLYDNKEKAFVSNKEYKSEATANKVAERRNQDFGGHRYSAEKYSDIVAMKTPRPSGAGTGASTGSAGEIKALTNPRAMKKGGKVRGHGIEQRGKTKGKMV